MHFVTHDKRACPNVLMKTEEASSQICLKDVTEEKNKQIQKLLEETRAVKS